MNSESGLSASGNWTRPYVVGNFYNPKNFASMDVLDTIGYISPSMVSLGESGLIILDISNPCNPYSIGNYGSSAFREIHAVENLVYLINSSCFLVLNVSNPSTPKLLGFNDSITPSSFYIQDDLAYLAIEMSGLHIFNISDPLNLIYIGQYPGYANSWKLFVLNDILFIGDNGQSKLHLLNVSNPYLPILIKTYDYNNKHFTDILGANNVLYLSFYCGNNLGCVEFLDISDPENVVSLSEYHTEGYSGDLELSNDILFVSGSDDLMGGIYILNVSNPQNPFLITKTIFDKGGTGSLCYSNGFLYTAYEYSTEIYKGNFRIIDPGFDTDQDGYPDQAELYVFGTDPNNLLSHPDAVVYILMIAVVGLFLFLSFRKRKINTEIRNGKIVQKLRDAI